jgi:hypothetical protein
MPIFFGPIEVKVKFGTVTGLPMASFIFSNGEGTGPSWTGCSFGTTEMSLTPMRPSLGSLIESQPSTHSSYSPPAFWMCSASAAIALVKWSWSQS